MTAGVRSGPDVFVHGTFLARAFAWIQHALLAFWPPVRGTAVVAVHWLSRHTGLPALFVAAMLVVIGWKLVKKGARLAMQVALVTALLVILTELGVLHW